MKINNPRVAFQYNTLRDAWSLVEIAHRKRGLYGIPYQQQVSFIPNEVLKSILHTSRKRAVKIVFRFLNSSIEKAKRESIAFYTIRIVKQIWSKIENKYFVRLSRITQRPIYSKRFICYLTSGLMCPYNDKKNWFMISIRRPFPNSITTIAHELFHLQFLYYYKTYCKKYLNERQLDILKESLTVLLNLEFGDLLLTQDRGYTDHQKIRKILTKCWKKHHGNFQEFLNEILIEKSKYLR